ncbi:hypothetical protein H1R20_g10579, partial [Candolleomyces eurysporus]
MLFSPKNITFGVLLIPGYQWLDAVGSVDYINSHSHAMMQMPAATESLRAKAPIINWHYISSEGNLNPVSGSAGPPHIPTVNFTSWLLTVCTGSIYLAQSGLLDGVRVASNKVALKYLVETRGLNRKVKWVGDKRFVRDGKIWSSAGITSGLDLAAEFARVHFDPELVDYARNLTEYDSNPAQPDPFAPILDGVNLD